MNFTECYTKRLNLNVSKDTYKALKDVAIMEGRKTGNLARLILSRWARNRHEENDDEGEKSEKNLNENVKTSVQW